MFLVVDFRWIQMIKYKLRVTMNRLENEYDQVRMAIHKGKCIVKTTMHSIISDPSPDNNPEDNVGITQFLSNHDGFDGIIKYR